MSTISERVNPRISQKPGVWGFCLALVLSATTGVAHAAIFSDPSTTIAKPDTIDIQSPNYSSRGFGTTIDSIVMHTTEVNLSGTLNTFESTSSGVSAHFVIAPNGDLYQMVDTADKAWHATYYNSRSIGIEMVGYAGEADTWNRGNLTSLITLLTWLVATYDIPLEHPAGDAYDYPGDTFNAPGIVFHGQVQPWNRSDPGIYFPTDFVLDSVAARLAPEPASAMLLCLGAIALCGRRAPAGSRA